MGPKLSVVKMKNCVIIILFSVRRIFCISYVYFEKYSEKYVMHTYKIHIQCMYIYVYDKFALIIQFYILGLFYKLFEI